MDSSALCPVAVAAAFAAADAFAGSILIGAFTMQQRFHQHLIEEPY